MGRFPALHRVRKKGGSVSTGSGSDSGSGSVLKNYGNGQKALTSKVVHLIHVGQFSNERESRNRNRHRKSFLIWQIRCLQQEVRTWDERR